MLLVNQVIVVVKAYHWSVSHKSVVFVVLISESILSFSGANAVNVFPLFCLY